MKDAAETRKMVEKTYGDIARGRAGSCCGPTSCCGPDLQVDFADDYGGLDGYAPEADLGLGCGLPVPHAGIREGDTVLDLGSGAGNDVFVARSLVGETGRVIGVDMTADMVTLARENAARLGADNAEFHLGEIENLPLPDGEVDVAVSNCVLNLVPDKAAAFAEIRRVLRPGGHFCISDVVLQGELPAELAEAAMLYSGCVAGAMQKDDYLAVIAAAGFRDVEVVAAKEIVLPDAFVRDAAGESGLNAWRAAGVKILSITVTGVKPA